MKKKSNEQLSLEEERKKYKKEFRRIASRVKSQCKDQGLRTVELQLEYIKNNETQLPSKLLNKQDTIDAYEKGIEKFKDLLNKQKS